MSAIFSNPDTVATAIIALSSAGFIIFLAIPSFLQAAWRFREKELLKRLMEVNPLFSLMEKIVFLVNLDKHARNFMFISASFLFSGLLTLVYYVFEHISILAFSYFFIIFTLSFSISNMVIVYVQANNPLYVIRQMYFLYVIKEIGKNIKKREVKQKVSFKNVFKRVSFKNILKKISVNVERKREVRQTTSFIKHLDDDVIRDMVIVLLSQNIRSMEEKMIEDEKKCERKNKEEYYVNEDNPDYIW